MTAAAARRPVQPVLAENENFPIALQDAPVETWDDEGLTALERIYIYSRSELTFHRLFIIHNLPTFLDEVSSAEAVEYVIPLLSGLAVDEEETVKEALASELTSIIWWFVTHCRLVSDDITPAAIIAEEGDHTGAIEVMPLPVASFTPILGTLLLSANGLVGGPARMSVVDLLSRIRAASSSRPPSPSSSDPTDLGYFGPAERTLFESELLHQVVIGMGQLDFPHNLAPADDLYADADMLDAAIAAPLPDTPAGEYPYGPDPAHVALPPSLPPTPRGERAPWSLSSDATPVQSHAHPLTPILSPWRGESGGASADVVNPYFLGAEDSGGSPALSDTPTPTMGALRPGGSPMDAELLPAGALGEGSPSPSPSPGSTVPEMLSDTSTPDQLLSEHGPLSPTTPPEGVAAREEEVEKVGGGARASDVPWWEQTPGGMEEGEEGGAGGEGEGDGEQEEPMEAEVSEEAMAAAASEEAAMAAEASEQAAMGRLSSMSLIAAVTANGPLEDDMRDAFVQEVERSGQDTVYWVRREAAFAVGALAKVVPVEIVHGSLLPLFRVLCKDSSSHVKHAALFALPAIIARLTASERRALAVEVVLELAADDDQTVRAGVLESLGEVIYAFHEDKDGPPIELLRLFLGREEDRRFWEDRIQQIAATRPPTEPAARPAPQPTSNGIVWYTQVEVPVEPQGFFDEPARPLICAFNFPAVALAVRRARWAPLLRTTYTELARSEEPKVLRTLAASAGEVAKIVGPEHARADVLPVWRNAVRAPEAEVRLKAVVGVETLVRALDAGDRAAVVRALDEAWGAGLDGWREREAVARALIGLVGSLGERAEMLGELMRKALDDEVAAVREAAVGALPSLVGALGVRSEVRRRVVEGIRGLAASPSYRKRMTFVACQQAMVLAEGGDAVLVEDSFWRTLHQLAQDPIVNVRIGVARLVGLVCDRFFRDAVSIPGGVLDAVVQLAGDESPDVRAYVSVDWRARARFPPGPPPHDAAWTFSRPPPASPTVAPARL